MSKKLILVCVLLFTAFSIFGCNAGSGYADKNYTVKVTAINNGKYTALIGEAVENADGESATFPAEPPMHTFDPNMPKPTGDIPLHTFEPNMPKPTVEPKLDMPMDGQLGNGGIKPPPDGGMGIKPLESEKPFGEMPPEFPNDGMGEIPPMMQNNAVTFTETEGSITFEIPRTAQITKNSQNSSISEITVGSILKVNFDSNGNVSNIEILY